MLKSRIIGKALAVSALSLLLGLGMIMNAQAQQANPFEGQSDMTDAEAQKYLAAMSKMIEAGSDQAKIAAAMEKSGMDQMRFAFVMARFNAAIVIIQDGEAAKANIPPTMVPSEAEIAIVKKYEAEYMKIISQSGQ